MTSASTSSNHLIREKSPYLLQHAHNPVDWYPWGADAFDKAKREDKVILLSIGYSTCHWCHVMEKESFENLATAEIMNQYLVSIKVDREERPDIDKIYMTAVSAMTGQGGWPLNVFLTPDLKPIFGGTYFPPESKWGHPAWKDVVRHVGEAWKHPEERKTMLDQASHITESLKKYTDTNAVPIEGNPAWLTGGFQALKEAYDPARGGFGNAPKFPMPVYHNFLLRYWARTKEDAALQMSLQTLREMAKGGIYDHLGGGFARYSTDAHWHIPHFEKMLYDNAQLAVNYLEAYQITKDPEFKQTAMETLTYIQRDMTHPEGGFYSAEDADSLPLKDSPHKIEGAFYVWEKQEVKDDLFAFRYGVCDGGNAASDPHGEFKNKNILYIAHPIAETARQFKLSEADALAQLTKVKSDLLATRNLRPRPHLDDKIIAGWNGLMITAFAKAYQVLGDRKHLDSAQKAARFLKENLYNATTKTLYRRWRELPSSSFPAVSGGESMDPLPVAAGDDGILGIADDYAFVIQGLLDLYESDFNPAWLAWAQELTESMNLRFYDVDHGGYYMTAKDQDQNLILRVKEDSDNVEPSASSVAALNLLRLAQILDRKEYEEMALKTIQLYGATMMESPRALPQMLVALDFVLSEPRQIVIAGKAGIADTEALLHVVRQRFLPVKTLVLADEKSEMKPMEGKAAAYVCIRHACQSPTADPATLERLLQEIT